MVFKRMQVGDSLRRYFSYFAFYLKKLEKIKKITTFMLQIKMQFLIIYDFHFFLSRHIKFFFSCILLSKSNVNNNNLI